MLRASLKSALLHSLQRYPVLYLRSASAIAVLAHSRSSGIANFRLLSTSNKGGASSSSSSTHDSTDGGSVSMTFVEMKSGDKIVVDSAKIGKSVLDIALEHDIDIEGACGGEMACSTCHVILDEALYRKLPAKREEEQDMLDLAWGLTDTSRLCCQIKVTKDLEGAEFRVPVETNSML